MTSYFHFIFFQIVIWFKFLLTSLLKTSVLLMDERLPALHLELLDIVRETVELVMFFLEISCHRLENSHLFCSSSSFVLLDSLDYLERFACAFRSYAVVVETKGQIERASYCRQTLEKPH